MPIWLRNFTFNSIKDWHDKQAEQYEQNNSPSQSTKSPQVKGPDISPSYSTKASNY